MSDPSTPSTPSTDEPTDVPEEQSRRWWLAALAVVVIALIAIIVVLALDDGDDGDSAATTTAPLETTTTTGSTTTTSSTAPSTTVATPPVVDRSSAVWPVADSTIRPTSPVLAAQGFATSFLGFRSPVMGPFRQGDSRSGEVDVRPEASGPVTTVLVRQLTGEQTWSVLGATTPNIDITAPATSSTISSPLTVRGQAIAFEGNVVVEIREDGNHDSLGTAPVTGGGDVKRPFEGSISFGTPTQPYGTVVFLTHSAEDGQVWEASVIRVRLMG